MAIPPFDGGMLGCTVPLSHFPKPYLFLGREVVDQRLLPARRS